MKNIAVRCLAKEAGLAELQLHLSHLDSIDEEIETLQSQIRSLRQSRLAHLEVVFGLARQMGEEDRIRRRFNLSRDR